eukprot:5635261-Alexandrium_andersonii.AAC.1
MRGPEKAVRDTACVCELHVRVRLGTWFLESLKSPGVLVPGILDNSDIGPSGCVDRVPSCSEREQCLPGLAALFRSHQRYKLRAISEQY